MTTALQIINRAAEWAGYKDPSETLDGTDSANFLAVLNDLVGTWNTQRLSIVSTTTVSASVSASPVSIGTSQTLDTTRPVRIERAWIRENNNDYKVEEITSAEYDAIPNKSDTSTLPRKFFYSPGLASGSIYLWPVPSAAVSLYVRVMVQLSSFAALATDYDLAPGYKRALEYSLAEEIWPNRISPKMAQLAYSARRSLHVANYEPVLIEKLDAASAGAFNINTGE